ncbi:MAG TPA: hypothetical protein DD725_06480 [Deltaproteobacteria bacterium]|nr:hypothetical protein [Deltaproteobacteria bacterium]
MPIVSYNLSQFKKLFSSKYTCIAIILIVSFGVYLNTMWNGFVYDDEFQVLENPWIKDVRYIHDIFLSHVWAFQGVGWVSNYYRPMMHIILMIDYYLFGLKPWGYHLINIILHAGVSVLVFLIASMLINHPGRREKRLSPPFTGGEKGEGEYNLLFPLIAAILFAAHPIHTEVVAWVSGIPELSFTLFYLLSFYFYIKADDEYGKHFILSILFFFLSTLCKETALTLPILLIVYDYSSSQSKIQNLKSHMMRYIPYIIVAGIYFTLRTNAIGGFAPQKAHPELDNWQYLINIFPLFIQYLEKLILPINLNAYHVLHPISSILEWKAIASVIITFAFILTAYFLRKIDKLSFFSLLLIVITILPVLYIPALGENTFAERYLYLPSIGFVILMALTLERIYCNRRLGQTASLATILAAIVLLGLYCAGTLKRNFIWRDNYTLWSETVKKSPDGAIPHNSMGVVYLKQGRLDEALQEFQTALKLEPDYSNAHINLGISFANKGWLDDAIKEFKLAIRLKSDNPEAYNNLGATYYDKGWVDMAIEHYLIALRLKPNYRKAHYNLAEAYYDKGWVDMAIEHYRIAQDLK